VSSSTVTRRSGAAAPTTAAGADARRLAAVRRGVLGIGAALVAGLAVELAVSRHWQTPSQAIAWAALGSVAAAGVLAALRRAPRTRLAMLAVVGVISLVGVVLHLSAALMILATACEPAHRPQAPTSS
jgi:hypothetical protein